MNLQTARGLFEILEAPLHIFSKSDMGVIGGKVGTPETLVRWVNAATRPEDFYVCLNPSSTNRIKPSIEDITAFRFWLIDLDPCDGATAFDSIYATDVLQDMFGRLPAFYRVFSGRGRQLWLPIENGPEPISNQTAQELVRGCTQELIRGGETRFLANGFRVDTACAEISHLARLPGTTNTKTGKEADLQTDEYGWPKLNHGPPLSAWEMAPYRAATPEPDPLGEIDFSTSHGTLSLFNALTWRNRAFIMGGQDSHLGSRHERLYTCCKQLHTLGAPAELALSLLRQGAAMSNPNLLRTDPGFVERTWKGIYESSRS